MFSVPSFAVESYPDAVTGDQIVAADFLNELGILPYSNNGSETGLFSGTGNKYGITGNKYGLEKVSIRLDGAIMLIRVLGKEKEVKEGNYSHPFTDVPK